MTDRPIPDDLKAIEADTLAGADYGGFEYWGNRLAWVARWVGDAPGDDPKDTTWDVLIDAEGKVAALGYAIGESWNDHDTAYFEVMGIG